LTRIAGRRRPLDFDFQGTTFTAEEVCRALALQGQLDGVLLEALRVRCMPEWAGRIDVAVTDEQVQEFADGYRVAHDLHEAEETEEFLRRADLDEDGFSAYCQAQALRLAVRDHLGTEERVHTHFMAHLNAFDRARISRLVVDEEELANELRMRIVEDAEDFHKLAREHSRDEETRPAGGYAGWVHREDLYNEAGAQVFTASAGALVGPLAQGEQYLLVLVEEVRKAQLDDEVREQIRDRLLAEWEMEMMSQGSGM
jgi:parvulin-like peptidyl-prolyl isomerase